MYRSLSMKGFITELSTTHCLLKNHLEPGQFWVVISSKAFLWIASSSYWASPTVFFKESPETRQIYGCCMQQSLPMNSITQLITAHGLLSNHLQSWQIFTCYIHHGLHIKSLITQLRTIHCLLTNLEPGHICGCDLLHAWRPTYKNHHSAEHHPLFV